MGRREAVFFQHTVNTGWEHTLLWGIREACLRCLTWCKSYVSHFTKGSEIWSLRNHLHECKIKYMNFAIVFHFKSVVDFGIIFFKDPETHSAFLKSVELHYVYISTRQSRNWLNILYSHFCMIAKKCLQFSFSIQIFLHLYMPSLTLVWITFVPANRDSGSPS